jgi:hypothetical protein
LAVAGTAWAGLLVVLDASGGCEVMIIKNRDLDEKWSATPRSLELELGGCFGGRAGAGGCGADSTCCFGIYAEFGWMAEFDRFSW